MKTFGWQTFWKNFSARLSNVISSQRKKDPIVQAKDVHYSVHVRVKIKSGAKGVERLVKAAILNDVWTVATKGVKVSAGVDNVSFTLNVHYYTIAAGKIGQLMDTLNSLEGVAGVVLLSD